ncbi:MAG: MotA/TolQ/ExbB proton channel family protein [Steroidobacteraceae bacterium]|nr:MotA/TolQ/ExbB proton channel family protein [Steroidobacteraceae bacterium]
MNSPSAVAEAVSARAPYPKRPFSGRELFFSIASLLVIAILVQTFYATVIRPRAEVLLAQANQVDETGSPDRSKLRSVWVVIRDVEQEVAFILALWSLTLIAQQARALSRNRKLLEKVYVEVDENHVVLPEDARAYARPLERLPFEEQEMFLPRALMVGLNRFGATKSVQDAAEAVIDECEYESSRLDAQLSMVRFTAWAIPAIGFVGTVRGIGHALTEAQRALHGDISGVTLGLGVTFNATLTALSLSIVVMFFLHQLQQAQDRLVLDTRTYIDRGLIRHMRVYK